LGLRLRRLREEARMTLEEAAKPLEWSTSKLSRIENGQLVDIHGLKSMLDLYCVTGDKWPDYYHLLAEAKKRNWWHNYGLHDKGYVPMEADAVSVRDFTLSYVPGLLQISDYSRALFTAVGGHSTEGLRNDVVVRMIRQKRLTAKQDRLQLEAVMSEAALHHAVGGSRVMLTQLRHLIETAALDSVTLRILPMSVGAHPSMDGVFTLLSFGDLGEPDVVYTENLLGSSHSEKEPIVLRATLAFNRLREAALSPGDSIALIRQAAALYQG
jgi:transcriptional regulator with XRE-family HTH domain